MFMKFAIRTKIICVVSVLLLALAGSGLLAASNMRAMNTNTSEIATNWLPSVKALGELNAGIILYRATLRAHLLVETVDEKAAVEKTLGKIVDNNTRIRKNYEAMINSPDERALYDDWSKLWQEYRDIAAKVMELSRKEAGQYPREAIELNKRGGSQGRQGRRQQRVRCHPCRALEQGDIEWDQQQTPEPNGKPGERRRPILRRWSSLRSSSERPPSWAPRSDSMSYATFRRV